jgi:hypothetical protein
VGAIDSLILRDAVLSDLKRPIGLQKKAHRTAKEGPILTKASDCKRRPIGPTFSQALEGAMWREGSCRVANPWRL